MASDHICFFLLMFSIYSPIMEAGELPVLAWLTCSGSRRLLLDTRSSAAAKLLLESFW